MFYTLWSTLCPKEREKDAASKKGFVKLQKFQQQGCRQSSVDSSVPTILPPRVWVPSTPSMLVSLLVFVLYLPWEKNKIKQKEAEFGPLKSFNNDNIDKQVKDNSRKRSYTLNYLYSSYLDADYLDTC